MTTGIVRELVGQQLSRAASMPCRGRVYCMLLIKLQQPAADMAANYPTTISRTMIRVLVGRSFLDVPWAYIHGGGVLYRNSHSTIAVRLIRVQYSYSTADMAADHPHDHQ